MGKGMDSFPPIGFLETFHKEAIHFPRFVRAEENVLLLYGKFQEIQWVGTNPFLSPCKAHLIPTNLIAQIRRKITLSSRGPRTRRQRIVRSVENISAVCGHGNECAQHTIIPNRPRRYRDDQKKRCQCEALPSLAFTSQNDERGKPKDR